MNTKLNENVADAMGWKGVLDFSGDISKAFHHVIKAMRAGGYQYTLESFNVGKRQARCLFVHEDGTCDFAYGETEAEAICRAALAVMK